MKRISVAVIAGAVICSAFVGCGKSGGVSTDGSTSMSKVIGALGESFENETGISVSFNGTGSGSGIQAVLEGRCDIGLSSRALKDEEKQKGLKATPLAYDGIAIIVNPENPIKDLSSEAIAKIYTGEITNWQTLGGNNLKIVLIGREAGSGTREGFEAVTATADKCKYRRELTSTGDVITAVAENPAAVGYASLASVKETVKVLAVGGVTPNEQTVRDGSYTVSRPFLLVTRENTELSAAAREFFDFVTSGKADKIISAAGAVPADREESTDE